MLQASIVSLTKEAETVLALITLGSEAYIKKGKKKEISLTIIKYSVIGIFFFDL